ncbi:MAG TPA: DUF3332 family protein [Vulgatibacter sp.]
MRRRLALLLAASLFATSCFGTFRLTREVWKFNRDVGGRWVQEIVFVALLIIPVYEVVVLVDAIVFNTSDFWTGRTSTVDAGTLPAEKVVSLPDGSELRLVRESDDLLRVEHGDQVRLFHRTADGFEALDESGAVLAKVAGVVNGDVEVKDAAGTHTYEVESLALVGDSAASLAAWAAEQVRARQMAARE